MRKTADEELSPQTIPLITPCPRCGGNHLKAFVLVGLGIFKPVRQGCMTCPFTKDFTRGK